jgi:tetratricopeptide (TPR) repeat protein
MKRLCLLLCFSIFPLFGWAGLDASIADLQFEEARKAYDAGEMDQAIDHYQKILDEGFYSSELFYNIANARFRKGEIGLAILNYRRAQSLTPHDPDIKANLAFAIRTSGADVPGSGVLQLVAQWLPSSWWFASLVGTYWLTAGCFILYFVWRDTRWKKLGLFGLLLGLGTGTGLLLRQLEDRRQEVVMTEGETSIRFAPLTSSNVHFTLPEGSIAVLEADEGPWLKIRSGENIGYLPREACAIVQSW